MIRIETAMVLAAGLGTRMRPLTANKPKPLIEVAGKPLIDHMLDALAEDGVPRAIVNVHYCADQVQAHLARRAAGPHTTISDEREILLETGGALAKAAPLLGEAPIFVMNTDQVWIDEGEKALKRLRRAWDPLAMDALLLLCPLERAMGFEGRGDFFCAKDGRLGRRGVAEAAPFAYMGVQIFNPALLRDARVEPFSTNILWDKALTRGRLFGALFDGVWMHVGDPAARDAAEERLGSVRAL